MFDKSQYLESIKDFIVKSVRVIDSNLSVDGERRYLDEINRLEQARSEFISKCRTIPLGCESFFSILRKWNSYTPSLPTSSKKQLNQFSIGGGYYLYIKQKTDNTIDPGYGLVIDPGYNFIHNFGQAGFCLDDIDGILITHAHNDHTNDFESILSLLYQRNDKKFIGNREPKKVDLFLNVGSFKKFSNYLDLTKKRDDTKNYIGKVTVMSPGQVIKIPERDLDFEMYTLYTNHNEIVTNDYSLGICFRLSDKNILLTGDTGWKIETVEKNRNFVDKYESTFEKIDVLIPHIGSVKKTELEILDEFNVEHFYASHLGLLGTICAIEHWKPELCVISEFGEELISIREQLVKAIALPFKKMFKEMICLPGDIGLFIMISSRKTICYYSKKFIGWEDIDYSDVSEGSVNIIKYYKTGAMDEAAEKLEILKTIKIENGINIINDHYRLKIKSDCNITVNNIDEIIEEISSAPTKAEVPIKQLEYDNYIINRIMLLTCDDNGCDSVIKAINKNASNKYVVDTLKAVYKLSDTKICELMQQVNAQ